MKMERSQTRPRRLRRDRPALFSPQSWTYLWSYFRPRWASVVLVAALGALQSAVFLPTLYLARFAFDEAVPKGQISLLIWIGAGLFAFRLLGSGLLLVARAMALSVTKATIRQMRQDLITILYALPRDYFGRNDAARVQTRVVMESERVDNLVNLLLSSVLPALLTSAFLLAALLYLNALLVLLLALLAPLIWISTIWGGRFVKHEVLAFQHAFEAFSQGVQFVLRQMDLTRIRGFEGAEISRQTDGLYRLESSGVRMAMSFAWHQQVQASLTGAGGLLLLVGGGIAVARQAMSLGDLLAFYLAAASLNAAVSRLTATIPELIAGDASLGKLLDLHREVTPSPYQGKAQASFQGGISLQNVYFSYKDKPLLKDVSLELKPGSRVAIVGANGAGKSTIVNLILGLYRPDAGALTVDGQRYEGVDLAFLRRQIGVVMQKPTFFTATIAENLSYGWPGVPREALIEASKRACADTFVQTLSAGYDTLIGEGGALISGGEAQRLAIARALIGAPKLLILDEPTNHLDADAVIEIMRHITEQAKDVAILIISHDMSVVGFADTILRLKEGSLKPARRRNAADSY